MSLCISTSLIGLPRIRAVPAVGKIKPRSSLIVVDFPAPLGPMKPNTSPVSTCIFSPSSEVFFCRCRNPNGYSFVRFSISIAKPVMGIVLASKEAVVNTSVRECVLSENRNPDYRLNQLMWNQESPRPCPICTSCGCGAGGAGGAIGFRFCGPRQLSNIPTCCTQETVHRAAQNFSVKYSRCRISGVYSASGIPGYPRCCEHQCTSPSSQM